MPYDVNPPQLRNLISYNQVKLLGSGDNNVHFLFYGATAPSGPGPPRYRGFTITLSYTSPHSVGLLWTSDQPDAETST